MVEGLSDNRWALLSKVHHCMVDGVSATDLMTVMFDDSPPAGRPERAWLPAPEPSDVGARRAQLVPPGGSVRPSSYGSSRATLCAGHDATLDAGAGAASAGSARRPGLLQTAGASSSLTGSVGSAPDLEHAPTCPPERRQS